MKNVLKVLCAILTIGFASCEEPEPIVAPNTTIASLGTPAENEIWFTTYDSRELMALNEAAFDAEIVNIEYSDYGINVITFADKITTIGKGAFDNCRNLENISLPESVTTIGERAFFECHNLECMTLGSQIKSCGYQAFDNCVSLYSLHISSIGDWCQIEFANSTANPICYSGGVVINGKRVTSVAIPAWVSHIGDYAFYNYATMANVKIPKTIKSIGQDAFDGCEGLTKVEVEDIAAWCQIDFATALSNPLSYASSLYVGNSPATNISLTGVEKINARAFQGCNNIRSFVADNSLKTIDEEAFRGCMELSSVDLGTSVKEIGGRAFMGCSALKSVKCLIATPPVLGDKYVFDYNANGRKIYIPEEAYNIYTTAEYWSKYADSFEGI